MRMTTIAAAFAEWAETFKPEIDPDDGPAMAESWNDYTDSLCKDGAFTSLQYTYCPAYDDDIPDDDAEFLLERLGVSLAPWPGGGVTFKRGENGELFVYPLPDGTIRPGASDADMFEAVSLECEATDDDAPLLRIFSKAELSDLRDAINAR